MTNVTRRILAAMAALAMLFSMAACGSSGSSQANNSSSEAASGVEDGVLTIAMECAYAPYNWAQADDSNGAVPVSGTDFYANGYDVMTAKAICEYNGWELEIKQLDWDSLIPAVQSGIVDAVIAGQSMTSERMESVDFAGPYIRATFCCLVKSGSKYENATGISDFAGATCTSQSGTVWYDSCLPQMEGVNIQAPSESAPAMLMAVESGVVDFVCCDIPTALGAVQVYPDLVLLNFAGTDDDFAPSQEDSDVGISVRKGNTVLKEAIDAYLADKTDDDFNELMDYAVSIQPISE